MEVVIVDGSSKDRTVEIIKEFMKEHPELNIKIIREGERRGKSHAVNVGYRVSTGEIKIISDADAVLEKDAIKKIIANFADPAVGACTARQVLLNVYENPNTKAEGAYRTFYEILRYGESCLDSTPIFHGELSAFRKNLIEPVPENSNGDDSHMAITIRKKGYRSVYDKDVVFYEYSPASSRTRYIQKVRRGQGLVRVFWRHRDILFNNKYGRFGKIIYPMEFYMHIVSPFLVAAFLILGFVTFIYDPLFVGGLLVIGGFLGMMINLFFKNANFSKYRVNVFHIVGSFLYLQIILLIAIVKLVTGQSMHIWQKVEDVRTNEMWREGIC